MSSDYGSGTIGGVGFGNKTSTDPEFDGHDTRFDKHTDTRSYQGGHESYGSGATGGAGFGNKSAPDANLEQYDNSDLRFGSHQNTDPYSNGTEFGSGSTEGAGFGNKTGGFGNGEYCSSGLCSMESG